MKFRLLRLFLFAGAFAWAVSVFGVILPWQAAKAALNGLGAGPIPDDPMLNYWLRMAAGAFTGVGIFYFVVALDPKKYAVTLPWLSSLLFIEGLVLMVYGLRLHLPPFPFYFDTAACLFIGGGIWVLRKEVGVKDGNS